MLGLIRDGRRAARGGCPPGVQRPPAAGLAGGLACRLGAFRIRGRAGRAGAGGAVAQPRRGPRRDRSGLRRGGVPGAVVAACPPGRGRAGSVRAARFSPLALGAGLVAVGTAASRVRGRALLLVAVLAALGQRSVPAGQPRGRRDRQGRIPRVLVHGDRVRLGAVCACPARAGRLAAGAGRAAGSRPATQRRAGAGGRAAAHRPGDARRAGPPAVAAQRACRGAGIPSRRPAGGDDPGRRRDPGLGLRPRSASCAR